MKPLMAVILCTFTSFHKELPEKQQHLSANYFFQFWAVYSKNAIPKWMPFKIERSKAVFDHASPAYALSCFLWHDFQPCRNSAGNHPGASGKSFIAFRLYPVQKIAAFCRSIIIPARHHRRQPAPHRLFWPVFPAPLFKITATRIMLLRLAGTYLDDWYSVVIVPVYFLPCRNRKISLHLFNRQERLPDEKKFIFL